MPDLVSIRTLNIAARVAIRPVLKSVINALNAI
jgi:hypothetical protein